SQQAANEVAAHPLRPSHPGSGRGNDLRGIDGETVNVPAREFLERGARRALYRQPLARRRDPGATVVLCGGVLYLVRHGGEPADHKVFKGEPPNLVSPRGIVESALALESRGIIELGLLLLIATPVARVVFSIYAFARQRDGLYVALTTTVL